MKTPQEIDVWYVLPSIRKELAKALHGKGIRQREIATHLGVTEAAVSQYINSKRAKDIKLPLTIKKEIAAAADNMSQKRNCYRFELQNILEMVRKSGFLCVVHRRYDNDVPACCNVCLDGAHKSGCPAKRADKLDQSIQ